MVKVSAPGKLFLSGEWSILEVGNPGIVAAVNKRVYVDVSDSTDEKIHITIRDFDIHNLKAGFDGDELKFERELNEKEKQDTLFMKASIETALKYLGNWKPFKIESWGEETVIEIEGKKKKVGFGSSAASVVAVIAGILKFHGEDIESAQAKKKIYKLAAITHYFAQGKVGSAFDVAASTYGGVFVYQRFDPNWLIDKVESGMSLRDIVEQEWPSFKVEPLEIPEDFELIIGWTKQSASTSAMVKQMRGFKESSPEEYKKIYDNIANLVKEIIAAWKERDKERILQLLRKNEEYLRELGQKSGVNIETEDLRKLSELANEVGAAGKLSGAGGGDCGIAVCFDKEIGEAVKEKWKEAGFYIVNATVDRDGVRTEN